MSLASGHRAGPARPGAAPADTFGTALDLHRRGRIEAAAARYAEVLRDSPGHRDALHMLGVALHQLGQHDQALGFIEAALAIRPDAMALSNLGLVQTALERFDEAVRSCDRAIALAPDCAAAFNNRAAALISLRRYAEALESCDRAIALKPDYAEALSNRGFALTNLRRFAEALDSCERAIALRPDFAEALNNRGVALVDLRRHAEALRSYDRAIGLRPGYADAFGNRAIALAEIERFDEALRDHERAIALAPESAEAHFNLALCRLTNGDFESGWREYEWRWRKDDRRASLRRFAQPLWTGAADPEGRTVLLHAEQGLGDTIQFCRYASLVADRGARVVLEVQGALAGLLRSLAGPHAVIAKGEPLPPFDLHCPLLTLPLAFGTALATIPCRTPYLSADAAKLAQWRERLGPRGGRRVGLAWSGQLLNRNDHRRSIPLALLAEALPPGVEAHSLQKEIRPADQATLAAHGRITDHSARLADFDDTAALVAQMDLVVSVDTSVAHLAAALGKPTWVLLQHVPEWRWLVGRSDSPWYPTARLFRQPDFDDWESVVAAVRQALSGDGAVASAPATAR
jgi:tetratricopeptide (TPR) repeat protein